MKQSTNLSAVLVICLCLCLTAIPVLAESGFKEVTVYGQFELFKDLLEKQGQTYSPQRNKSSYAIQPIRISSSIPGLGRTKIILDRKRFDNIKRAGFLTAKGFQADGQHIDLFKGSIETREGIFPASGAVYRNRKGNRVLTLNVTGRRLGRKHLNSYAIRINLDDLARRKQANFSRTPYLRNLGCATEGPGGGISSLHNPLALHGKVSADAEFRVLEVAAYADAEWFTQFGTNSNQEMITIINAAETIYENQLSVTFDIVATTTLTANPTGLTATSSTVLLGNFGTYIEDNNLGSAADIHHLFSYKDFDGSTVGVAWIGAVCDATSYYKTGINQYINPTLTYLVFAHELGHNFNAQHDSITTPETLMFPSLGATQNQFSATSISEINNFIASSGSCLSQVSMTPVPTSTPTPVVTQAPTTPPISGVPPTSPGLPLSKYKVSGKVSFGKKTVNRRASGFKPRLVFTNSESAASSSKALRSNLKFAVKLFEGSYQVELELKQNKVKDKVTIGTLTVTPGMNKVNIILPEDILPASTRKFNPRRRRS